MALLVMESWDGFGGDATQFARKWSGSSLLSSAQAKTGTYSIGNASGQSVYLTRGIAPVGTTLIFGFWLYWTSGSAGSILITSSPLHTGFNGQCGIELRTDGTIRVLDGSGFGNVATSAAVLNTGAWNYIEAKLVVADSGAYTVKCNGTQVLNGSGDLRGDGTTTAIGGFTIGVATSYWVDNFWMFDASGSALNDFPSEKLIVPCFLPNADGAASELTPSTGVDHYALVDEAIANDDTDYNSGAGGSGLKDLYGFDFSSLAGRTRYASQLSMCAKSTSGAATLAGVAHSGGVNYIGAAQSVTTSYAYYEDRRTA